MFNKTIWNYYKKLSELDKTYRNNCKLPGDVAAFYQANPDSLNIIAKAFLGDDVRLSVSEPTEEEMSLLHFKLHRNKLSDVQLNDSQLASIVSALKNDVTIIRGLAGTGKTTIVNAAVKYLQKMEPDAKVAVISYNYGLFDLYSLLNSDISEYDYLFIDGAERLSNFEGLAALSLAEHVMLLGDDQQLPPFRPHDFYDEDLMIDIPAVYCDTGNRNFMRTCLTVFGKNCYINCLDINYTHHPALVQLMNECCASNTYVKAMIEDDGKLPLRVRWYSGDEIVWHEHKTMGVSRLYTTDYNNKQNNIFIKDELPEILEILKTNPDYSICVVSTIKTQLLRLENDIYNALGDSVDLVENTLTPSIPGVPFVYKLILNGNDKKLYDRVYYLSIHDSGRKPFSQKLEVINHVISLAKSELCIILSLNWLPLDIKEASKCSFKKKLVTYDETLGCLMERVHDMIEKDGRIVDQGFGFVEDTLMNTSNFTPVYIVSKEGDTLIDVTNEFVFEKIKNAFEQDAEFDAFKFFSHPSYLKPEKLLPLIKANMNCYIYTGYFDHITDEYMTCVISPSDNEAVVACLELAIEYGISSWEAIMICLDEEDNIEWSEEGSSS